MSKNTFLHQISTKNYTFFKNYIINFKSELHFVTVLKIQNSTTQAYNGVYLLNVTPFSIKKKASQNKWRNI